MKFHLHRCDADPTALAKYVLALLKKDKPQVELQGCMAEQLDVFLGKETEPFLEKLFVVINTSEYLNVAEAKPSELVAAPLESTPPLSQTSTVSSPYSATRKGKDLREENKPSSSTGYSKKVAVTAPNKSKSQEPISKCLSENRDVRLRSRRISNRSKSKSKSRSRSKSAERNERVRRSRSRDRRIAEQKNRGAHRNASPPRRPKPYRNIARVNRSRSRSVSPSPAYRKSPVTDEFGKQSKRCRDFDEKGYCMRGETCPWDHGNDPVVLEDTSNPMLSMNPPSMNMRNGPIHSEYNPDNPELWNRGPPGFNGNRMHLPVQTPRPPYLVGNFRGGPPFGLHLPPGVAPLNRELIPVPVMDPNHPGDMPAHLKRRFEPEDGAALPEGKRKQPINSRLGPRVNQAGISNSSQNCSLELRKIPRGLNAISHLNDHFSKFGKITNIQIAYEGDPEAAIVSFTTHAEANVAYRSTEAVLNNRFIKVFWHSGTGTGENQSMNGPTGSLPKVSELSVRRFPSTSQAMTSSPIASDNTNSAKAQPSTVDTSSSNIAAIAPKGSTTYINAASPAAQQAQQRLNNAKLTRAANEMIQKKQKEQHKKVIEIAQSLFQKKQELIDTYMVQMRTVTDKLSRTDSLDPSRSELIGTIKYLETTIKDLQADQVAASNKIASKPQPVPLQRKTKEQQQKELLDVELELISKEQHGDDDTYAIKKRYIELQRSLGRPSFASPQRPAVTRSRFGTTSVDRRPTSIQITGFALEDSESLLGHFKVSSTIFD